VADEFERWLGELRVDDDARARARRHWLRTAAEEDASLPGVLLDLAERGATVAVVTTLGRRHHGPVVVVGEDFVALRTGTDRHVVLRLDGVATIRVVDDGVAPLGDREVAATLLLVDVLIGLSADRLDASLLLASGDQVAGEVRSVGHDVVVVRTHDAPHTTTYVRLDSIVEVAQDGPIVSP
jgi:hypothetical protein